VAREDIGSTVSEFGLLSVVESAMRRWRVLRLPLRILDSIQIDLGSVSRSPFCRSNRANRNDVES